jgi:hypothetical protein
MLPFLILYLGMIYWFLILLFILIVIVAASFINKHAVEKKTLAGIKERWGQPKAIYRNFKLIAAYLTASGGEYATSANDLDLDDVFAYIDRAASKPGQQCLFKKLHSPNISEGSFKPLEQLIEKFTGDPQLREWAELKLSALNSDNAYYLPELFCKKQQSLFGPAVQFYIRMAAPLVIALGAGLIIAPNPVYASLLFVCIIANFIIHYSNKTKMLAYTHSLPQLIKLYNAGKWLSDNDLLEKSDGVKKSLANMANLKKSLSFINVQNKVAADPTDISLLFAGWIKIFFLLESL